MQKIKSADQMFHNGDGRQELGTVVTAEWLNAVQGELVAAIEGAAIVLNDNDNGQLLKAINKIVTTAVGGANQNANGKVSKTGDTMTGALTVKSRYPGQLFTAIKMQNEGATTNTGVGIEAWFDDRQRGWLGFVIDSSGSEFTVSTDRTGTVLPLMRVNESGIWMRSGGWLDNIFAKQQDVRWVINDYPRFHNGARSYYHPASGLKMIAMAATLSGGQSLISLPETFSGGFFPFGCDVGEARYSIGVSANGNSGLIAHAPAGMGCRFFCIGTHEQ